MAVKGIERVKRNYKLIINDIDQTKTEAAVYAVLSQGAAIAQVHTPVDTSALVNSQYAPQIEQQAGKTVGQVGYTASYAAAVHNAPGVMKGIPRHNGNGEYWDPDAEPGFLTKGFEELKPIIPRILEAEYRV